MKRVMVLGANGMLGHRLFAECEGRFETMGTVRGERIPPSAAGVLDPQRIVPGVTVEDQGSLEAAIATFRPDAVVNCIGLVKQRPEALDAAALVAANSLFPHVAATTCERHGARLIHLSTDCVFSGARGGYTEDDRPDPIDLYGRSKLAGEPEGQRVLVLRTSMVGHELERASGLLEWFLAQDGPISGFPNALFSGPTTGALSSLICDLVDDEPTLAGTFHVGAEPISKLDLLELFRDEFGREIEITPDPSVRIDRSLDPARLHERTGWQAPAWSAMVSDMAGERSGDAVG